MAVFTSDGKRLLTLSKSGVIELWDQRGALIGNIRASSGIIIGLDINYNSEIVFAQSDGSITTASINENNIYKIYGTQTYFKKAQFSSKNDDLLMVAKSGAVFIRKSGENFMKKVVNINSENEIDVSFSYDDSKLIVSQDDGLSMFSIVDGSHYKFFNFDRLAQSGNNFTYHRSIQSSADRSQFASFGHIFRNTHIDNPIKIKGSFFKMDRFSNDNKYLVTHSRYKFAQIWDAVTGNLVKEIDTGIMEKIGNVDISDDNLSIAISIGRTVQVWSLSTASKIMQGSDYILPIEWAVLLSDESAVMIGGRDGIIRILSSGTGREILSMRGHKGAVRYLARSKNRNIALSQGEDNTIRIWNISNGEGLIVMNGYGEPLSTFVQYGNDFGGFNYSGNFVYKVQGNGTVVIKEISLLNEINHAKIVEMICSDLLTNITRKYSDRQAEDPVITDRNLAAIRTGDVCQK
jgi:WD40 repeat protein